MPTAIEPHHHRNTTKVSHKPYKPRFTSKNALKDRAKGKVEQLEVRPKKTRHQEVMSKFDRKNQAKQKRISKHQDHIQTTGIFTGREGAPRIVAVVPLTDDVSASSAVRSLNKALDLDDDVAVEGSTRVSIDRFKQKLQYVTVRKNLLETLDACRAADYVLFVLSATEEVDEKGEAMIRCIESQGVSQVFTCVQNLEAVEPPKKRPQTVVSLKSFITHFFPTQEKVFSLDSPQECQNLLRSLCTSTPKGIKWREDRSWMFAEDVTWERSASKAPASDAAIARTTAVITGVVRGRNWHADRLVQVGDWGEYQVEQILAAPLEVAPKRKETMAIDSKSQTSNALDQPSAEQDTLEELAPEETIMEDYDAAARSVAASEAKGVLLDDERHYEHQDDEDEDHPRPKRLPRGTSAYQSAWYLDDVSDSGSDLSDVEDDYQDAAMADTDIVDDFRPSSSHAHHENAFTDIEPSEYPASEAFNDTSPEDDPGLATYRAERARKAAQEDLTFPDEIELPPEVPARERLARYRGLKSSKTSPWLTEEDLPHQPPEWPRLLEINDYKAAKSRALRETLLGGVKPGTRIHIHLRDVPLSLLENHDTARPLMLTSMLRHEHKRTAVDVSITLSSDHPEPIRSKETLIAQIGPRRFVVNPLFSQAGNTPNNVHKFERWLHPGRTCVASFVAPLTWGSVPVLFFKPSAGHASKAREGDAGEGMDIDTTTTSSESEQELVFIGTGTTLPSTSRPPIPVNPSSTTNQATSAQRIIAKRAILTGEPYKLSKRLVSVRYMFFSKKDVEWFKSLPLFTNHGQRGTIKESLGTHGHFKAVFENKVSVMDSVGVQLWKRVWPRWAQRWAPGQMIEVEGTQDVDGGAEAPMLVGEM